MVFAVVRLHRRERGNSTQRGWNMRILVIDATVDEILEMAGALPKDVIARFHMEARK